MVAEWLSALLSCPGHAKAGHVAAFHPAGFAAPARSSACRGSMDPRSEVRRLPHPGHKAGPDVTLLSRNGHHFNGRFPDIAFLLRALPAKAAIIDAELVALLQHRHAGLSQAPRLGRRVRQSVLVGIRPVASQRQ